MPRAVPGGISWTLPGRCGAPLDSRSTARMASEPRAIRSLLLLAALAGAPAIGWFLVDGRMMIDLADEGFLWYGSRAVRQGLVPIRDFQAYDPGRYAWTAAWSLLLGESLVALRFACVLFQVLGLSAGLLVARRLWPRPAFLACVAVALCLWMAPRYKTFEPSLALMSLAAAVGLLERPTLARHLGVGLFGGLAAFFGRNHGVYHLAAFVPLIAWAAWGAGGRETIRRYLAWAAGIVAASLPHLAMLAFVPGYAGAFAASLAEILEKGTNLPIPVPWPWRAGEDLPWWTRAVVLGIGWTFVALPAFLAVALARAARLGRGGLAAHPVLVASIAVGVPYAHHVFSRADLIHLGALAPILVLGLLALAGTFGRARLLAPILLAASLPPTLHWTRIAVEVRTFPEEFPAVDVGGAEMRISRYDAAVLDGARRIASELAGPAEPIFFAPNQPALYAATGRLSPTRQIYFIHPATPEEDEALAGELHASGVGWAMLRDYALDGRDDLRFVNTHPRSADWLRANFALVPFPGLPPGEIVVRRTRGAAPR